MRTHVQPAALLPTTDPHVPTPAASPQVLKQLADAQKELGEAIAEGEEAAAQAAAAGDGEDAAVAAAAAEAADDGSEGSEAGFGFEQEAFSAEQLGVARAAQALLVAVGGMVRAVVKLLLGERCAAASGGGALRPALVDGLLAAVVCECLGPGSLPCCHCRT